MDGVADSLQHELTKALSSLADLRVEFAGLADPDVMALDDEHDSEGATIGFERARIAGLIARTERRVAALEAARQRTADGSYRYCDDCGGEIGADRLEALPGTRLCITCSARSAPGMRRPRV